MISANTVMRHCDDAKFDKAQRKYDRLEPDDEMTEEKEREIEERKMEARRLMRG